MTDRNPFATRFVRPGSIPYRLPAGESFDHLIARLRSSDWLGEVTGDHGTGKSTFVKTLIPFIQSAGRIVHFIQIQPGESRLPATDRDTNSWDGDTQIIVDGFDQVVAKDRKALESACRQRRSGLLVTTHKPTGLPTLFRTSPDVEILKVIVRDLQAETDRRVLDADVEASFMAKTGSIREALFDLYDLYEQRRQPAERE